MAEFKCTVYPCTFINYVYYYYINTVEHRIYYAVAGDSFSVLCGSGYCSGVVAKAVVAFVANMSTKVKFDLVNYDDNVGVGICDLAFQLLRVIL